MPTCRELAEDLEKEDEDTFEEELPEEDPYGRNKYLEACKALGVSPISQVLKFLEGETLQVMHYGLNMRSVKALVSALQVNTCLRVIRLTDNAMPDEAIKLLCEVLTLTHHNISEVDLGSNRLAAQGAGALANVLTSNNCTLKSLGLSKVGLGDKDGGVLAAALEVNTTLKTLDLSANDLGDRAAAAMGRMLATNLSLTDLNLSWNKLRPRGMAMVGEGLRSNVTLQVLGLAWCGIQDAGAEHAGQMLFHNQGLADVELAGNGFSLVGCRALCVGVAVSPTLAAIRLSNNDLREEGVQELIQAIDKNKGMVVCDIDNTNCSQQAHLALEALLVIRHKAKHVSSGGHHAHRSEHGSIV